MRNRYCAILAVFMAAVFILASCSGTGAVEVGDSAPDFSLTDIDGNIVNLSEFKGKVVILDFFASWCPPCRQEIPDFVALQKVYASESVTMVGISLVDREESKSFAKSMNINYPVLVDDGSASKAYGPVRSIPTTFVIDKNFKIVKKYIGYRPKSVFENDIKELI